LNKRRKKERGPNDGKKERGPNDGKKERGRNDGRKKADNTSLKIKNNNNYHKTLNKTERKKKKKNHYVKHVAKQIESYRAFAISLEVARLISFTFLASFGISSGEARISSDDFTMREPEQSDRWTDRGR
jgi:hypothetical protein